MKPEPSTNNSGLADCPECMGTGWIDAKNCSSCNATGKIIVHSHQHGHGSDTHEHPHAHSHPHRPGDGTAHDHGHE